MKASDLKKIAYESKNSYNLNATEREISICFSLIHHHVLRLITKEAEDGKLLAIVTIDKKTFKEINCNDLAKDVDGLPDKEVMLEIKRVFERDGYDVLMESNDGLMSSSYVLEIRWGQPTT